VLSMQDRGRVPSGNYSRYKSPFPNVPITRLIIDHTKIMMQTRQPHDSHVLDENLETTRANAMRTPHLHFSQIRWRHVAAQPAAVLSSGLALEGILFAVVDGVRTIADDDDDGEGVGTVASCVTCSLEFPLSFSPMFGKSRSSGEEYSGKISLNRGCSKFHEWLRAANWRLCVSDDVTDPVVISSESMKESRPVKIVATLQAGFQEPGWKSDIEKHIFLFGWKRPDGVNILMPGGLKGYSDGKSRTP